MIFCSDQNRKDAVGLRATLIVFFLTVININININTITLSMVCFILIQHLRVIPYDANHCLDYIR